LPTEIRFSVELPLELLEQLDEIVGKRRRGRYIRAALIRQVECDRLRSQAWFSTEEWQEGERQASADIAADWVMDIPEGKTDLVAGEYEIDLPPDSPGVGVKITDMLGEEISEREADAIIEARGTLTPPLRPSLFT